MLGLTFRTLSWRKVETLGLFDELFQFLLDVVRKRIKGANVPERACITALLAIHILGTEEQANTLLAIHVPNFAKDWADGGKSLSCPHQKNLCSCLPHGLPGCCFPV